MIGREKDLTRTMLKFLFTLSLLALLLGSPSFVSADGGSDSASASVSASASASPTPVVDTTFTDTQREAMKAGAEKYEFQAEVSRMMDIIINSLYTKVEIFLRELISNASDALDKIRFKSLADASALGSGAQASLEIRIAGNKEANTLTIRDTGVGMTKQDLINYLGTVARSGTASLMEQLASGGDLNLIGQFGVGFYSVYLVADRVRVVTKNNDDKQYIWESDAGGSYTIVEDPRGATLGRGTEITLFLKESDKEFADEKKLRELVTRYSEFITFPIYLETTFKETVQVPVESEAEEEEASPSPSPAAAAGEEEEDGELAAEKVEDASPSASPAPKTRSEERVTKEWEVVNDQKAIWSREPKDVADGEYNKFFKAMVKDESAEAHTWIHFKGEGDIEFRSILYTPSTAPGDLYENYYSTSAALRLYVRKVLISDDFEDLLPRYLNFIRGVVDSDDLPLNVSREQLQQAKILKMIQKKLVRKALEMVRRLASAQTKAWEDKAKGVTGGEEEGKKGGEEEGSGEEEGPAIPSHLAKDALKVYTKFWDTFGRNIKLGLIEDTSNRSKLAKLLRYKSSKSLVTSKAGNSSVYRSLDEYLEAMPEDQKQIYYIAGESLEAVQKSPFLEKVTQKGLEVLFLTEPIDEYVIQNLPEYGGKRLQSIAKEGLQLPAETADEKRLEEAYKESFKPLSTYLKKVYGDKVEKVVVSARLATSPCVLVTSQFGYSANMERILKSQAFADPTRANVMHAKKIMELNPRHPIIAGMLSKLGGVGAEDVSGEVADAARVLYDVSLLNSGFSLEEPAEYSARIYKLVNSGLMGSGASMELLPEMQLPPEEAEEAAAPSAAPAAGEEEEDL